MEANAKSFEVVVHAKRTPKRNADVLEEASSAAKEVVASWSSMWSSTWSSTWSPKFGTRKKGDFGQESEHSSHHNLFTHVQTFSETAKVPSETGVLAPKVPNSSAFS
eukprot:5579216-Prymnesium_polylepis.1